MTVTSRPVIAASPAEDAVDWERTYRDLLPKVYRFFCYRLGEAQAAEDLTATTFERAWRGRQRYRRDLGAFSSWLFGIARKVAADHFRNQRIHLTLEDADARPWEEPLDEAVQRKADFERLAGLLEVLAPREREIISLKYGAQLTNRMIAREMGLSESNVGTIVHRVVGRLRGQWEESG